MPANAQSRLAVTPGLERRLPLVVTALLLAAIGVPGAAGAAAAGYVLAVEGNWTLSGGASALRVGAEIPGGATLTVKNPGASDAITVVARKTGLVLVSLHCGDPGACAKPVQLPGVSTADSESALGGLLDKVIARFKGSPGRYVSNISRGDPPLDDAVLELRRGALDLQPVFVHARARSYFVQLTPLTCAPNKVCPASLEPRSYQWNPAAVEMLPAPGLQPGLYELAAIRPGAASAEPGNIVWVRVANSPRVEAMKITFRHGSELVAGWNQQVDVPTKRAFRRALVEVLADD